MVLDDDQSQGPSDYYSLHDGEYDWDDPLGEKDSPIGISADIRHRIMEIRRQEPGLVPSRIAGRIYEEKGVDLSPETITRILGRAHGYKNGK